MSKHSMGPWAAESSSSHCMILQGGHIGTIQPCVEHPMCTGLRTWNYDGSSTDQADGHNSAPGLLQRWDVEQQFQTRLLASKRNYQSLGKLIKHIGDKTIEDYDLENLFRPSICYLTVKIGQDLGRHQCPGPMYY